MIFLLEKDISQKQLPLVEKIDEMLITSLNRFVSQQIKISLFYILLQSVRLQVKLVI